MPLTNIELTEDFDDLRLLNKFLVPVKQGNVEIIIDVLFKAKEKKNLLAT